MGFLKNFFQFVFLDKFKYSFCKLRKQPFHVVALVNCNALHKTNMPTVRGQHHGNHCVLCQCFQWNCCNEKPMKNEFLGIQQMNMISKYYFN